MAKDGLRTRVTRKKMIDPEIATLRGALETGYIGWLGRVGKFQFLLLLRRQVAGKQCRKKSDVRAGSSTRFIFT
jgi:hypothetical protein